MRVDIVGAGPVGLGLAIQLLNARSQAPPRVHLWERASAPYSTPCGEGVLESHLRLVPGVDHGRHVASHIHCVRVQGPAPPILELPARAVVLDRARWIGALASKATDLGARIQWGTKVSSTSVAHLPGHVVVGADGPASRLAALRQVTRRMVPAVQARMVSRASETGAMRFVWDPARGLDYAWAFPRRHETTVGLLGPNGSQARARLTALARSLGVESTRVTFQSWPVPVGGRLVQRGRFALVGDAAGAAHPLTKGGIAPGLLQSSLLAGLILQGRPRAFQQEFERSPLWPDPAWRAWEALRRRGAHVWRRVPWGPEPEFRVTRNNTRRLALRTVLANVFRPSLLVDLHRIAQGLRHAVAYGW